MIALAIAATYALGVGMGILLGISLTQWDDNETREAQ